MIRFAAGRLANEDRLRVRFQITDEKHGGGERAASSDDEEFAWLINLVATNQAMNERQVQLRVATTVPANVQHKAIYRVGFYEGEEAFAEVGDGFILLLSYRVVLHIDGL